MCAPLSRLRTSLGIIAAILLGAALAGAADSEPTFHGVRFKISLGMGSGGARQGYLYLAFNSPSPIIAQRRGIALVGDRAEFQEIRDAGGIRQVSAPGAFVDLVTTSPSRYEVRFYDLSKRGTLTNGLYVPIGAPYHINVIEDPDAADIGLQRLRISNSTTGLVSDYSWVAANYGWTVVATKPDGSAEESIKVVTAWQSDPGQNNAIRPLGWTVYAAKRDASGRVTARSHRSLYGFPWGDELVQEVSGLEGAEEVTTYYFQQDSAAPDYGKLVGKTFPDGSWEYYEHNSAKLQTKSRTPSGNEPYPGSDAVSRVVKTTHGQFWSTLDLPTTMVVETVRGAETARRYLVREKLGPQVKTTEVECRTPGANIRAADNQVTQTWSHPLDHPFANEPIRILRPDGMLETYTYSLDPATRERTTMASRGQPDASQTAVKEGICTITRRSVSEVVLSETVVDVATGRPPGQ